MGDVLAGSAVAPGRGAHQAAVLIEDADGEAVQFGLRHVIDVFLPQSFPDPPVKGTHLVLVEGILQ